MKIIIKGDPCLALLLVLVHDTHTFVSVGGPWNLRFFFFSSLLSTIKEILIIIF